MFLYRGDIYYVHECNAISTDNRQVMAAMQPTKMQSKLIISLQNSPNSENELMAETKSSDNDSSLSVGRTGRVRKAKVVFDPSEVENKRRSMPNMEAAKATKRCVATTANIASALVENKSILNDAELPSNATINKRRKTIGVAFENGCIVCTRADIKKGRFVNCIGCTKRGHYTCLRNGKLYKATDSEKRWQCPSCKICKACQEAQTNASISLSFRKKFPNSKHETLIFFTYLFK